MCVKEWKRIAEWEAMHYRERKAFLKGVSDAGGGESQRTAHARSWVEAIENVLRYLARYDPEKERFFRRCYGLDDGRALYRKRGIIPLTFEFHAGQSTLYEWRNEVLTLLLLAAGANGALKPFREED
jgi:hypothetical protein